MLKSTFFCDELTYVVVIPRLRVSAVAFKRRSVVTISCGRLREARMVPRLNLQLEKLIPGRSLPCGTSAAVRREHPVLAIAVRIVTPPFLTRRLLWTSR